MATLVGRVGFVIKGAWDSGVAYAAMDVVTYNNSTYIAKQAVPAGTLPTNTTYWELSLDASLLQTKADGANKVASATSGDFAALDANGDLIDSGHKHSDYVTDVSGKADKVTGATSGNFAGLDANGNLTNATVENYTSFTKPASSIVISNGALSILKYGKLVNVIFNGNVSELPIGTSGVLYENLPIPQIPTSALLFKATSAPEIYPIYVDTDGKMKTISANGYTSGWRYGSFFYLEA